MNEILRLATEDDIMLLYNWVNDYAVRASSFSNKKIMLEEHRKWFKDKINSEKSDIYIFIWNNVPVGQIRIDYYDEIGIIDYSIAKEYRGNGLADRMLKLAEKKVKENRKEIDILRAEVKTENKISQKKFENQGYSKYITYEKRIR